MKISWVYLQATGWSNLKASPTLVALFEVQMQITGALLIIHQRPERTGCFDQLACCGIRALLRKPVFIKVHRIVHGAAGRASHAAKR